MYLYSVQTLTLAGNLTHFRLKFTIYDVQGMYNGRSQNIPRYLRYSFKFIYCTNLLFTDRNSISDTYKIQLQWIE